MQINESCFGKRKYEHGRIIRSQQWVFGGIDLLTRECFLTIVVQRNTNILIPIIEEYILPGTEMFIT